MNNFVIVTDSCADLNGQLRKKYNIEYLCMRVIEGIVDRPADLDWQFMPAKTFYDKMRKGVRFTTSQITASDYAEAFEKYISGGSDILSISCSSALSGSYRASTEARDKVLSAHPDAKIICIDSLNACIGLGLICITASRLRAEGKTIEQTAQYIEDNKLKMNQYSFADDLTYLRRAGRVSPTSAVFGGLLKIKPIIISDAAGQNVAAEKVKGRGPATNRLLQLVKEHYKSSPYQLVAVAHADCPAEAEAFRQRLKDVIPDKDVEILLDCIGPIVGATVGPGTLAVYFYGDEVTFKA